MRQKDYFELIELNNRFYRENSASFADTRTKPWEGWGSALKSVKLPENAVVNDFAAGNLRFEKFLLAEYGAEQFRQLNVIDNCADLLLCESDNFITDLVRYQEKDILTELISMPRSAPNNGIVSNNCADLTVSFGFMHHVPDFNLRLRFIDNLINATKNGGYIIISLWNFASTQVERTKYSEYTTQYFTKHERIDLETEDYIIGWKNLPDAHRYCHNFNEGEIIQIEDYIRSCGGKITSRFKSDGKTNDQNWYIMVRM